jgi:hypothetical protein
MFFDLQIFFAFLVVKNSVICINVEDFSRSRVSSVWVFKDVLNFINDRVETTHFGPFLLENSDTYGTIIGNVKMKNGRLKLEFRSGVRIFLGHKKGHFPFYVCIDARGFLVKRKNYPEEENETIL